MKNLTAEAWKHGEKLIMDSMNQKFNNPEKNNRAQENAKKNNNYEEPNAESPSSISGILDINTKISLFSEIISDKKSTEFEVIQAIKQLGELGDVKAVYTLLQTLSNPQNTVVASAIESLGKIGDKTTNAHIIEKICDGNPGVRIAVARAIGFSKDISCFQEMINLLESKNENIRLAVTDSLGKIGSELALPRLLEIAAKDPSSEVRAEAAKSAVFILTSAGVEKISIAQIEKIKSFFESAKKKETISFVRGIFDGCINTLYMLSYAKKSEIEFERIAENKLDQKPEDKQFTDGKDEIEKLKAEKQESENRAVAIENTVAQLQQKLKEVENIEPVTIAGTNGILNGPVEYTNSGVAQRKKKELFYRVIIWILSSVIITGGILFLQGIRLRDRQKKTNKRTPAFC